MKITIPAPFPAVTGTVTMADDDSIGFVSDDGAINVSGLVPTYPNGIFSAPDLRAALDAGTITAYSKIVGFNGAGGIAIDLKSGEQWIATVTVPVE